LTRLLKLLSIRTKRKMNTHECLNLLAEFSSEIRKLTLKRLDEVPKGFINWRLNNTAMSFADIVQHLINVDELFLNIATTHEKNFKWTLGSEEPHLHVDEATYEAMLKKLDEFQLKRHSVIRSLKDAAVNEQITDDKGENMTLWWFLMRQVLEHEVYHRGQIAAYLKILKGESTKFK